MKRISANSKTVFCILPQLLHNNFSLKIKLFKSLGQLVFSIPFDFIHQAMTLQAQSEFSPRGRLHLLVHRQLNLRKPGQKPLEFRRMKKELHKGFVIRGISNHSKLFERIGNRKMRLKTELNVKLNNFKLVQPTRNLKKSLFLKIKTSSFSRSLTLAVGC